jgi:hypothetical protein
MRLTIPIIGTVLVEGDLSGTGGLEGDPNDPIRPVDIDLGNVSWRTISLDLDARTMDIEVTPDDVVLDGDVQRAATAAEQLTFLEYAQAQVNRI